MVKKDNNIQINFCGESSWLNIIGETSEYEYSDLQGLINTYIDSEEELKKMLDASAYDDFPCAMSSSSIASFLKMAKDIEYYDYNDQSEAEEKDIIRSAKSFRENEIVSFTWQPKSSNADVINIDDHYEVMVVIKALFQPIEVKSFYGLYNVYLGPVPSNGARHPFSGYFIIPEDDSYCAVYQYIESRDELEKISTIKYHERSILFIIACDFSKMQARYPHSYSLNDIYLEYGHLLYNLAALDQNCGLQTILVKEEIFSDIIDLDIFNVFRITRKSYSIDSKELKF